jgi:Domain of unknown function (DUF4349)
MDSDIRFLSELERGLDKVATLERFKPAQEPAVAVRRHRPRRWKPWVGAAAAVLTLAWGIGFLAQGGLHFAATSRESSASQAPIVGSPFLPSAPANPPAAPGTIKSVGDEQATTEQRGSDEQGLAGIGYAGASTTPAPASPANSGGPTDLAKIERDGSLAITVANGSFKQAFRAAIAIAIANGGSLLASETQDSGTGTLTLKVPAAHFDRALVELQKLGHVDASSVTGRDVTAEYIDQQAHLRILRNERNVLSQLVNNSNNVSQIVSLTARVGAIQEQIDATVGQLRYLNDQVAQSTIKATISERGATAAELQTTNDDITNPSLARAWERGIQGFFGVLASVVVGLGYLVPLALIAAIIAAPIMAVRRRHREAI